MAALATGSVVAGYRIEGLLGQGGMGVVYRAQSLESGAALALKVIAGELASDEIFRERFRREALAATALDHPNVVRVLEASDHEGVLYLAMELIDGVDLATLIERKRVLDVDLAVTVLAQVASGLDAAHAAGLVHRDIKPANILVSGTDDAPRAYLTDFGVARRLHQRTRLTGTGLVVGTVGYLAPEALRGQGAGPAADIYALGCVLFEALSGGPPFAADNDLAVILAHVDEAPPPLAERVSGISAELERVVQRALAKDPAERYASASAFARAATSALQSDDATEIRPPPDAGGQQPFDATAPLATATPSRPRREPTPTRKRVTLLHTSLGTQASLDPELRLAATDHLERIAEPILERHGATIEPSPMGGVIGVFGLPRLHEDDAAHALGAAVALHEELGVKSGGADAPISVVTTDLVLAGGDTPHASTLGGLLQEAFRLRQNAGPGDIVVSAVTRDFAAGSGRFGPLTDSGEATAWRVLGLAPPRSAGSTTAALVGREHELGELGRILQDGTANRCARLVSIVGAPGVGKSRLAKAFLAAARRKATVACTRCRPPGEADARQPVRELLSQLVPAGSSTVIRDRLPADDAEAVAEQVERLLGVRDGVVPADEVPWIMRRVLWAVSAERPVVTLFEDIHWAEDTLLELIEHVAEWSGDSPLLILCSTRPELLTRRADWGEGITNAELLLLQPLPERASIALLDELLGATPLSDTLRSRILEVAEGNPLFIEQIVALIRDHPDGADEVTIPPNIRSLLAARVDQLEDEERTVLTHASVIGREFSQDALATLLAGAGATHPLKRVLPSLARRDLVEPASGHADPSETYRFRHALILDAAYDSLPASARSELHEQHADWLEGRRSGMVPDEAVAHHLEQAFKHRHLLDPADARTAVLGRRASAALGRAGLGAFQRDDAEVAADLLERALALPWENDSEQAAVLPTLGEALVNTGDYERAETFLQQAVKRGRDSSDVRLEANAELQLVALHLSATNADPGALLERVRRAIRLLRDEHDIRGLAEAHMRAAELLEIQGQIVAADTELDAALEYARPAADDRQIARILGLINGGKWQGPEHVDGLEAHCQDCLRWARQRPERWILEASALQMLAWVHALRGDFGRARALIEEASSTPQERGPRWFQAQRASWAAEVELLAGDAEAAETLLRDSYKLCEEIGDTGTLCSVAAILAHALLSQTPQPLDEALRLTELSEATAAPGDVHAQLHWRTARALIVARDEPQAAERLAREAVAHADGTDYVVWRAHAYESLAEVLECRGEPNEALEALRTAHGLYLAKGHRVKTEALEALIAQAEESHA